MKNQHFNHFPHRMGWADIRDMQELQSIKAETIMGAAGLLAFIIVLFSIAG